MGISGIGKGSGPVLQYAGLEIPYSTVCGIGNTVLHGIRKQGGVTVRTGMRPSQAYPPSLGHDEYVAMA